MTDYVPSLIIDQVIVALKVLILPFITGATSAQIVRGQGNRVAMPPSPCVILTEMFQANLSRPVFQNNPDYQVLASSITSPTRIDVQIDFYGPLAGDYCRAIEAAFNCGYAFDKMPATIKPLYTSDGVQAPLVTGEQQYESRWTLTASMQYNPVVTLPQQSAIEASATINIPVDET